MSNLTRPLTRALTQPLARRITSPGIGGGSAAPKTPLDLIIVGGQSNAMGYGNSASSVSGTYGLYIDGSTIGSTPLTDPVGPANTGSMWPAFSNQWHTETGRLSAYVNKAVAGTGIIAATGTPNWSPSGTLRGLLVTAANQAIAAINASSTYELGDVKLVWLQGEAESRTINGSTITAAIYETEFGDLADYFVANIPELDHVDVIRIAFDPTARTYDDGYAAIREAQEAACAAKASLEMACRYPTSLNARSMMSGQHYSQVGYNALGAVAATGVAQGPFARDTAPTRLLAVQNYAASVVNGGGVTAKTVTRTTTAGTKAVVAVVTGHRLTSNTAFSFTGVTCKGQAMRVVKEVRANSASPAEQTYTGVYLLNDYEVSGGLDNVSANIVATSNLGSSFVDVVVFDCDAALTVDDMQFAGAASDPVNTRSFTYTTADAALIVGIAGSHATTATPRTCTWVGLNEQMDTGLSDATYSGQTSVAYLDSASTLVEQTISATFSGACNAMGCIVASFRKRFEGEP